MNKLFSGISDTWKTLNRSIYTGDRLKANLRALTFAGSLFAVVGLFLIFYDFATGQTGMAIGAVMTCLFGAACAFFAGIPEKREIAIIFPVLFCMVAFTVYTVTGFAEGSAILWTFTLPIGICYFVSVKYGIILSLYYIILFSVAFYTPFSAALRPFYTETFMHRFPLFYASAAILTDAAMIQYHKSVLAETEYTDRLNREVEKQTAVANLRADKLEMLNDEIAKMLAVTIDAKDRYTNGHSQRVALYSTALAREYGLDDEEINELEREALLHDIGKIGVPDLILNKPGRLTDDEFTVVKSHTTIGGNILSNAEGLIAAAEVAEHHHERWDGKGYPSGLSGKDIPFHARIVAIADAYDAMRSDRVYRKGLPLDVIRKELVSGREKQFDPQLLDCFIRLSEKGTLDEIAGKELFVQESR